MRDMTDRQRLSCWRLWRRFLRRRRRSHAFAVRPSGGAGSIDGSVRILESDPPQYAGARRVCQGLRGKNRHESELRGHHGTKEWMLTEPPAI